MSILDVSVVVPCYNAANTLLRSLDSIARQEALPREIIVVDDGSEHPIESIVLKWSATTTVSTRVLTQLNRGAPAARNSGIKAAQCRYIAFLDADDIWFPDKLKIQYDIMEAEKLTMSGHGYVFQASQLSASSNDYPGKSIHLKKIKRQHFLYGNPFFTPTVMVRKDSFAGFDERFRCVDDYKAWLENFRVGRCLYIGAVLAAGFKPPIGHSGLTASVDQMHQSYLAVLNALLIEGRINFFFYKSALLIEAIKLPIRRWRSKVWGF